MEQILIKQKALICEGCEECGKQMDPKDKCQCRPHLCYRCCNCGLDCDLCNCSVKFGNK